MGGFFHSYHQTALNLLESYRFQEPFALYLKQYFRKVKKHGSRDRKLIADLCFGFFRTGNSGLDLDVEQRIAIGYYLTHEEDNGYLNWLNFPLLASVSEKIETKLQHLFEEFPSFQFELYFPVATSLMQDIDSNIFFKSFLHQPPFFLRVRPGKREKLKSLLVNKNITGIWLDDMTVSIPSNINITDFITPDEEYVIQDLSSQHTFDLLKAINKPINHIWDVCSGSGGKSIMAADMFPNSKIYASDIREDILHELRRRMLVAGIRNCKSFCTDLEHPMSSAVVRSNIPTGGVDLIIADVPCTGSGTWSRSPERLLQMDAALIMDYQQRQKSIVSRLPQHLKKGGYFLYITCSVYKEENTEVVDSILNNTELELIGSEMIIGYERGGDNLYAALFTLPA